MSGREPAHVRRVDTSFESHPTEIEGRRIESKTRQGLEATNQPQRLVHRQSGASRANAKGLLSANRRDPDAEAARFVSASGLRGRFA